jgi:hypothetical protein
MLELMSNGAGQMERRLDVDSEHVYMNSNNLVYVKNYGREASQ